MRSIAASSLLFTLAACSSVLPSESVVGTYGGDQLEIRATASSFIVELPCQAADLPRPARVDDDGRFTIRGRTTSGSTPMLIGDDMVVSGRLGRDTLIASITLTPAGSDRSWTSVDTLIRGRRSPWTGGRVCIA